MKKKKKTWVRLKVQDEGRMTKQHGRAEMKVREEEVEAVVGANRITGQARTSGMDDLIRGTAGRVGGLRESGKERKEKVGKRERESS